MRLTKKRKQILEVLRRNHGSLSAAELHKKLPDIDLVTIYRSLDLFVEEKLIKQIHIGGGEAQYEYQQQPHHHAVCTNCERVIHFKAPDKKILQLLEPQDFKIEEMEIIVRGSCTNPKHH